ncbi:MAG: hypothetical protein GY710_05530 [Desulfobacteraceae bacterium]|nr:hypothetical protein [Desulfobacteraceae bacterium]
MFNKKEHYKNIEEHFQLNSYVDLVLNYDMANQSIGRVKIRKVDYWKNLLVMYQPGAPKARKGQIVNISTLYLRKNRLSLFGKVIQAESNFFIMKYIPEIILINLRRGFRENPKILFNIYGNIKIFEKERLISEKLILKDLSLTGVGFLSNGYKWNKDLLNKQLNIEGQIHLNFVNKKDQSTYAISGNVNLIRIVQTPNGFLEGYDFLGQESDDISKVVIDSQIAHRQAEIKLYD